MTYYDWNCLQKVLNNLKEGQTAEVGMQEDWYFTAETLTQDLIYDRIVAGIDGSDWATPVVRIYSADDRDCYEEKYCGTDKEE